MSRLVTIYKVLRIPDAARSRRIGTTAFDIVADSESAAIDKAKDQSTWDISAFSWRTDGSRVVVVEGDDRA